MTKTKAKRGANALKARLKAESDAQTSGTTTAAGNDDQQRPSFGCAVEPPLATLTFASKALQHQAMARMEAFYESNALQSGDEISNAPKNAAAPSPSSMQIPNAAQRRYLTLEEASKARLCAHYQAFNLPVESAKEWLLAMRAREGVTWEQTTKSGDGDAHNAAGQGRKVVNAEEEKVLRMLADCGALGQDVDMAAASKGSDFECKNVHGKNESDVLDQLQRLDLTSQTDAHHEPPSSNDDRAKQQKAESTTTTTTTAAAVQDPTLPSATTQQEQQQQQPQPAISYLITCTDASSLSHERLHALYHLSPHYRSSVSHSYASALSKRARKCVEAEMGMRGYAAVVWEDEWQAYVVDGEVEIGGGVAKGENEEARGELKRLAEVAWREVGMKGRLW
ncbi:unnamed protein product [Jaminaea pallidilutea]